jgi:hypothetical protein
MLTVLHTRLIAVLPDYQNLMAPTLSLSQHTMEN